MADKKYPFNDRAFQFQLEGKPVQGCKYPPKCCFTPTQPDAKNPGIYFNGYYNHESMDKPFSQALSFDNFRYFLNVVKAVANAPGEEQIVKQIAFKFYKDREFKHSGVTVGIVRSEAGMIYFAFKNKKIPTIPFNLMPHESIESQNKDGEQDDIRFVSKTFANTWVERNREMLERAISQSIELDTGSGGGSSSSSSSSSNDNSAPMDFDDDIPF